MIHRRTKFIALIALFLFCVSLVLFGGFEWFIYRMKADLRESRLVAAESEMRTRALGALEATIASSRENREKLASYILKEEGVIEFLNEVETIGREQGVKLTTQSIEEGAIDDTFESLTITVLLEGSFDSIMRTVRIFENLPVQSSVSSVTIGRGGTGSAWSATVRFSVTKYTSP